MTTVHLTKCPGLTNPKLCAHDMPTARRQTKFDMVYFLGLVNVFADLQFEIWLCRRHALGMHWACIGRSSHCSHLCHRLPTTVSLIKFTFFFCLSHATSFPVADVSSLRRRKITWGRGARLLVIVRCLSFVVCRSFVRAFVRSLLSSVDALRWRLADVTQRASHYFTYFECHSFHAPFIHPPSHYSIHYLAHSHTSSVICQVS